MTHRNTHSRRRLARLVLMTMLVGVSIITGSTGADATTTPGVNATPYNEGGEWWTTDGCSVVPDSGPDFNFHHACVHHDGCYRNHWSDRATCDQWFLND